MDKYTFTGSNLSPNSITFMLEGRIAFTIQKDGTVELGEAITLDDASRAFWEAIARFGFKPEGAPMVTDEAVDRAMRAFAPTTHNYYPNGYCAGDRDAMRAAVTAAIMGEG